jgi:hypothetical protein
MRQPIRALLAAAVAAAAILIAAAASSSAATSSTATAQTLSSAPGSLGTGGGAPPPAVSPSPGCGSEHASDTGPDATVASVPCIAGPQRRPQPLIVVPRSGMANIRPIAFTSAAVRSDDRTVDVRFWSGVEPCSVLDHVDVAYGTDAVTITLFDGCDPSSGMVACPDLAMLKQVTVQLDQGLAGRRIVDGAA